MGIVLVQEGKHIAFLSQALAPKHLGLSIHDKELIIVIMAMEILSRKESIHDKNEP